MLAFVTEFGRMPTFQKGARVAQDDLCASSANGAGWSFWGLISQGSGTSGFFQEHLAYNQKDNHQLPNLFVNLLQHLEIEADRFASGTKTIPGLVSG